MRNEKRNRADLLYKLTSVAIDKQNFRVAKLLSEYNFPFTEMDINKIKKLAKTNSEAKDLLEKIS